MPMRIYSALGSALFVASMGAAPRAAANDWPSWRGAEQTGMSREKAVVTKWSESGENLLWKVPVGGRTTPIVMNGRLFAITPDGSGECLRERVICLDADTGKTIWEYPVNVFHTDIVENRLGWTSVVGDPETGNIYVHATGGEFFCFSRDGKVLWKRSLSEEFGRYSGYGGRLHTPIIDEDRVIISYVYILTEWGTGPNKAGHRYIAFDKRTGVEQWWSDPGVKPEDTTYSTPIVTVINGKRLLIAGNADGRAYAMLARTGEKVWSFNLTKHGINCSVVADGKYVYVAHSEENIDNTEMGRVVCIDGSLTGDITPTGEVWRADGLTVGYSSPAIANGRLYVVTNSANMICLDAKTGKPYWEYKLGTVMKGSPVVTADGVIYTGDVNGRFHILKDEGDQCVSLDRKDFRREGRLDLEINGSPLIAGGRVYFMTSYDTYCLGSKDAKVDPVTIPPMAAEAAPDPSKPGALHVVPMEALLSPGERVTFKTKLFDVNGREIGWPDAEWSVDGVKGAISGPGAFLATNENAFSAGLVKAEANGLKAAARVRVSPRLPIHESFDDLPTGKQAPGWIGIDASTTLTEKDGGGVFMKKAESPSAPYCRMRGLSGPPIPIGYTVEADMLATAREGRIPILSDMGMVNCRYELILLGYEKQLRVVTYAPIPRLQKDVPFDWKPDTWYHGKLRVELRGDQALIRAKVWPRHTPEPEAWTAEMTDPCPHREGSPGLYAYSKGTTGSKHGSPVYFDNYQVRPND